MRDPDGVGGADGFNLGIGLVDQRLDTAVNGLGHFVILPFFVIPGWSEGPDPESRDSGFDASHRPGMATMDYLTSSFIAPSRPSMVIGNMRSENSRRMRVV